MNFIKFLKSLYENIAPKSVFDTKQKNQKCKMISRSKTYLQVKFYSNQSTSLVSNDVHKHADTHTCKDIGDY